MRCSTFGKESNRVGRFVETEILRPRVGVATTSGKSYYRISNLLKKIGIPFIDVIAYGAQDPDAPIPFSLLREYDLIVTTRKERLRFPSDKVICEEDLGDDASIAKQKLLALLYPTRSNDIFVVGIDPGERTGIAAFLNRREVESSVYMTLDAVLERVSALIDNAPNVKKVVKIGAGNPYRALHIARVVGEKYKNLVEIDLINESGTSALRRKGRAIAGTRDQRAARLIAFRAGMRYNP